VQGILDLPLDVTTHTRVTKRTFALLIAAETGSRGGQVQRREEADAAGRFRTLTDGWAYVGTKTELRRNWMGHEAG
jgi:hypothetical protein